MKWTKHNKPRPPAVRLTGTSVQKARLALRRRRLSNSDAVAPHTSVQIGIIILTVTNDTMDISSDLERVEEICSSDGEMEDDPEEIASKEGKEVRVSPATALAQRFGGIPGVQVGAKWRTRQDCCNASVHRQTTAGIHGTKKEGAFSIVMSCYYKDDKDFGDTIIYTGAGGRKRWTDDIPRKRIRQGPQIYDQQWTDRGNAALVTSRESGNPVRVIRSHRVVSDFAPAEGYRYDGLYTVMKAWKEKNSDNLDICRYELERVPGQPPLPRRSHQILG
ncbi:PUA-like domain-containing protein [Suillus ampliporus]|nr:PUA-like domain-containing protein [Suillus ampliporus]